MSGVCLCQYMPWGRGGGEVKGMAGWVPHAAPTRLVQLDGWRVQAAIQRWLLLGALSAMSHV